MRDNCTSLCLASLDLQTVLFGYLLTKSQIKVYTNYEGIGNLGLYSEVCIG